MRAATELDYIPNAFARGLKTRRSNLIALLVPEIVYSFYTTIARGVEDVTSKSNIHVILGNTDESTAKERDYIDLLIGSHVDGIVLAPVNSSSRSLKRLVDNQVPTVLIDRVVAGFPADVVHDDNVGGAAALTNHLLGLGHRRIAFLNGDRETSVAREREAGFRLACQQAGLTVDDDLVSSGQWDADDAERRIGQLLDSKTPFTAMIAANYFLVIGALRALRQRGCRVPEDIALTCFDDISGAAELDPFLTVIEQPAYAMGRLAAQLLLDRLTEAYTGPPRDIVVSPRLVVRRSCGAQLPQAHGVATEAPRLGAPDGGTTNTRVAH